VKPTLIAAALAATAGLSACAVVPAYGPGPYYDYDSEPYYGGYYGPPVIVAPPPVYVRPYGRWHHDHDRGWRRWH
jgi:hypothetical protein